MWKGVRSDPYLSPLFGDFSKGFPPTLVSVGTRDLFLSNVVRFHRALRAASVSSELHVLEAAANGGFDGISPVDVELNADIRRFSKPVQRRSLVQERHAGLNGCAGQIAHGLLAAGRMDPRTRKTAGCRAMHRRDDRRCGGANLFATLDRMALSLLQEQIKADLHLTDQQLGLLLGLAFALFYSTLAIPPARIADHSSRTRLLAICLGLWSLMTAASGMARNFSQLFILRMGAGVGEAGCFPAAQLLIGELFPRERRAIAVSVFQCGAVVGGSSGLLIFGMLGQHYGWRVSLQTIPISGQPLAFLLALTVRDPRSAQTVRDTREPVRQSKA
jgi:hypothetical protein